MPLEIVATAETPHATPRRALVALTEPLSPAKSFVVSGVAICAFFGLWTLAVQTGFVSDRFLPLPTVVFERLAGLLHNTFAGHTIEQHALASLVKFSRAFVLGAAVGIPIGLLMGLFTAFDYALRPLLNFYRFIPPIAWVPFGILWFGTGPLAPTIVIFAGTFTPCVLNAYAGVKAIDPVLIWSARCLGAGPMRMLREVLLPGALREVVAGLRISAGTGWQSLVGAELIVGTTGLGYMIVQAEAGLDTSSVMSGMIVIGVLGAIMDYGLRLLERRLSAHRQRR